eukprot:Clim_evm7s221 gene=Clim_evmTU7s221
MQSLNEGTQGAADEEKEQETEDIIDQNQDIDVGPNGSQFHGPAAKKHGKEIPAVDHTQITYSPFRRSFYVEAPEIANLSNEEVKLLRFELDGIECRGKDCPKPVKAWHVMGLTGALRRIIDANEYEQPTPIQAQGIPIMTSGRDMIGIARTGSGKTLAFLIPLFRHVMDQPRVRPGEGPIAIVLTPTRELATQIHAEASKFANALNIRVLSIYGGTSMPEQIGSLKRGAEVVVCTPGRMIDLLAANNGKVTNLKRITFVVLDEVDRMFDMGFQPQVMKLMANIRPDRQAVLFSATLPKALDQAAKMLLNKDSVAVEIGGRSIVSSTIKQYVHVLGEDKKFLKLLQVLGEYREEDTQALVFVDRQIKADGLLKDLMLAGYGDARSLHGAMDQVDRDDVIDDFKQGEISVLIATSVAARGLDVRKLGLVVNYDVPNHYEDYVQRCGRTGRAGRTGIAVTFITEDQDMYAPDVLRALELSKAEIPNELVDLERTFLERKKAGKRKAHSSGFGGHGYKFDEREAEEFDRKQKKHMQTVVPDDEEDIEESTDDGRVEEVAEDNVLDKYVGTVQEVPQASKETDTAIDNRQEKAAKIVEGATSDEKDAMKRSAAVMAALERAQKLTAKVMKETEVQKEQRKPVFYFEVAINDLPRRARIQMSKKTTMNAIEDLGKLSVEIRGVYVGPGAKAAGDQRKLYLHVASDDENLLIRARGEVKGILNSALRMAARMDSQKQATGRYSVV